MDSFTPTPSADDLLAHVGWVQALARSLVRDPSTADDLAQETWVAALASSRATNESPRGWLGRILQNRLLQRARGEGSRAVREQAHESGTESVSSDELLERIEQQQLLANVLTDLREPFRAAIILRYYEGLNATEIAQRLGEKPGTIRQRLKRGLEELREDLDGRFNGGREAWLSALLPLVKQGRLVPTAVGPIGTGAAGALGGALIVKQIAIVTCALVLAGSAIFFLRTPKVAEPTPAVATSDVEAESMTAPIRTASATDGESVTTRPGSEEVSVREPVPGAKQKATASAITGRVAWPGERPEYDETLEVFALADSTDYLTFVNSIVEDSSAILARTGVSRDGSFKFALPSELERAYLMVRGRHLYLRRTVEVQLGASPGVILAPTCGVFVRGRVIAPPEILEFNPSAIAGVQVRLWDDQIFGQGVLGEIKFSAETDGQGQFELRAVTVGENATLFANPGFFAARLVQLEGIASCSEFDLDVSLNLGGSVRGRVVDELGNAVPNASIRAILRGQYLGFDDHVVAKTVVDANGNFALNLVPFGEVFVIASADGFLESSKIPMELVVPAAADIGVIELAAGRSIAGRATYADGAPAADIPVSVQFDKGFQLGMTAFNALRGASGRARTDEQGHFRIAGLGAGPFVVEAEGVGTESSFAARADGVAPDTADLALVLHPKLAITGRVVTSTGAAVFPFEVRAVRIAEGAVGPMATHESSESYSQEDGYFTLGELLSGRWRVEVRSEGFAPAESQVVDLPATEALSFVVAPPASVAGVVIDSNGDFVTGAAVRLDSGLSVWQEMFAKTDDGSRAKTDERGRFLLTGLREGDCALRASADGFAFSAPVAMQLIAGEEHRGVSLQLMRGGRVTGEVFDEGKPAVGRVISLVQWGQGEFDNAMSKTDSNGLFEFENVEPGAWNVVAINLDDDWSSGKEGTNTAERMKSMKTAQVNVKEGETEHVVLGAPPKHPVILRGRVMSAGLPYGNAMISAHSIDGESGRESNISGIDENGEYSIELDGGGSYQLSVNRLGHSAGEISVLSFLHRIPDQPEVIVDLEIPAGAVAGRVVDEGGNALVGCSVTLVTGKNASLEQHFESRYSQLITDAEGRFEFRDLAQGSYRITASAGAELATVALDGIDIERDQWLRDIQLVLPRAGSVVVLARDDFGRAVEGMSIFARDANGSIVDLIAKTQTDENGIARYDGLAPGTYSFLARNSEFTSSREVTATVLSGETAELDLPVEVGGFLVIYAKNGRQLEAASFIVVDADEKVVTGLFTSPFEAQESSLQSLSGRRRVGPLPAGKFEVTVLTRSGARAQKSVRLQSGKERKLTLRPKPM